MTCPYWSTARYTYRQTPLTLTYVSSTCHLSPGEWRQNRAASANSGVNRNPPADRDVIDLHATLDQQLLNIAVRQAIAQVPAHGHHDHLRWEPEPGERRLR